MDRTRPKRVLLHGGFGLCGTGKTQGEGEPDA